MLGGLHPLDGGELVWHGAEQTVLFREASAGDLAGRQELEDMGGVEVERLCHCQKGGEVIVGDMEFPASNDLVL